MQPSEPDLAIPHEVAAPSPPLVTIHPDPDSLALTVAASIVREARRSVKHRGRFSMALAGGATPGRTYGLLARPPFVDLMPWPSIHIFWGDERCVDAGDPRSNERMAREALLDHVPIPPDQVHPMRCGAGAAGAGRPDDTRPERAACRWAAEHDALLRTFFAPRGTALDLVLLGLGEDGHTASLFPGSEVLKEEERWAAPVAADAGAGALRDLWRVTLTIPFINRAAAVVFLIDGPAKAAIVKEVLEGPLYTARLPAQLIRPKDGTLRWCLDDDSAALLAAR